MEQFLEKWNKLPTATKFVIIPIVWVLLGVGHYFLIYQEQEAEYIRLKSNFASERKKHDKYELVKQTLPRLKAQMKHHERQLNRAKTRLPTKKEIPVLLRKIDNLGKDERLHIKRFRPARPVPKGLYAEVPVDLQVQGTFTELMGFFNKVSNLDRIVHITRLRLSNPRFKNQKLLLAANFRLITFRFLGKKRKKKKKV